MSDLRQAAELIRRGEKGEARRIVGALLKGEPQNDEAWYYAGMLSESAEQRAKYLQRALDINPFHERANAALARTQVTESATPKKPAQKENTTGMMIAIGIVGLLLIGVVGYGALNVLRPAAPVILPTPAALSASDFALTATTARVTEADVPTATAALPTITPTPASYQITATAYLYLAQTADASLRLTATAAAGG